MSDLPVNGTALFGIGRAIKEMRNGARVTRVGWNGPGQYLELQTPDAYSKMTVDYIYITTVQGDLVPWLASQTDLLAEDWSTVYFEASSQEQVYGALA